MLKLNMILSLFRISILGKKADQTKKILPLFNIRVSENYCPMDVFFVAAEQTFAENDFPEKAKFQYFKLRDESDSEFQYRSESHDSS